VFEEEWRRFVEVFEKYAGRRPREKSVLRACLNMVLQLAASREVKASVLARELSRLEKIPREKAEKIAWKYLEPEEEKG